MDHGFPEGHDEDAFSSITDEDHFLLARLIRADAAHGHVFEIEIGLERQVLFHTPDAVMDALHFLYPRYGGSPLYVIHFEDEDRLMEHARQFGLYSNRRLPESETARILSLYRRVGPRYCDLIRVKGRTRAAVLELLVRNHLFVPGRRGDRPTKYPVSPTIEEIARRSRQWEACEDAYLRRHRADTPVAKLAQSLARPPAEIAARLSELTGDELPFSLVLRDLPAEAGDWSADDLLLLTKLVPIAGLKWIQAHLFPGRHLEPLAPVLESMAAEFGGTRRLSLTDRRTTTILAQIRYWLPATEHTLIRVILDLFRGLAVLPTPENDYRGWLVEEDALLRLLNPRIGTRLIADVLGRSREAYTYRAHRVDPSRSSPIGNSPQRTYQHVRVIPCQKLSEGRAMVEGREVLIDVIHRLQRAGHWILAPGFPEHLREKHQAHQECGRSIKLDERSTDYLREQYGRIPPHILSQIMGIPLKPLRGKAQRMQLTAYSHEKLPSVIAVLA